MSNDGQVRRLAARVLADGATTKEHVAELETVVSRPLDSDERWMDLAEALAMFAPGSGRPYLGLRELRAAIREAIVNNPG